MSKFRAYRNPTSIALWPKHLVLARTRSARIRLRGGNVGRSGLAPRRWPAQSGLLRPRGRVDQGARRGWWALAISTIAAASFIGAEGRLDRRGQILAARELSADRLDDMLDLGVRFDRPLLGGSCLCLG